MLSSCLHCGDMPDLSLLCKQPFSKIFFTVLIKILHLEVILQYVLVIIILVQKLFIFLKFVSTSEA